MSSGSLEKKNFDQEMEQAKKEGFEVIQSTADYLLLDLDTPEQFAQFEKMLPEVKKHFPCNISDRWYSKSGNRHVVVQLEAPLSFYQRLVLQAVLGSDPTREMLSLVRIKNGISEPSCLFKPGKTT